VHSLCIGDAFRGTSDIHEKGEEEKESAKVNEY